LLRSRTSAIVDAMPSNADKLTAAQRLERPGYVVMKKSPSVGAGDNPGSRGFEG